MTKQIHSAGFATVLYDDYSRSGRRPIDLSLVAVQGGRPLEPWRRPEPGWTKVNVHGAIQRS